MPVSWPARWRPTSLPSRGCRENRRPSPRPAPASRGSRPARRRTSRSRRPRPGRCHAGGPSRPTRSPTTACARSLSGEQSTTWSTPGASRKRAAAAARRVVGLELHHRPDDEAERPRRPLGELELRQQVRVDAGARLVAGVQPVAERLDDVVEGAGDVRHARRREEHPQAAQQADRRADLAARRRPVVGGAPKWLRKSS